MPDRDEAEIARDLAASGLLEESAEDLYENAPCGYLSTRPDGTIVKVNETFLAWTGLVRDELVGRRRFADLLTAGGRIYHETHYAPLLAMQGRVREIAVDIVCADGRRLPVLVNSVLRRDEHGAPLVVRTAVVDATERRDYERELLRAREDAERAAERARLLARTLQASLIPPAPPHVPGLDVAGAYRPAGEGDEVGGDFYDVFETGRNDWALVIGDVRGKGVEAAAVTALARYTLRAAAMRTRRPKVVLHTLNDALLRQQAERFCTAVYARLRPQARNHCRVTLSSAGHPLPVAAVAGEAPRPVGRPGTLLGVLADPVLHDTSIDLGPGDVVVFYTDGVTEARRGEEFYDDERLMAAIGDARHDSAAAIAGVIVDDVLAFQEGFARDDIAVTVVKVPA